MSIEANKELVSRFYEAIQQKNYYALEDFCHKDFVFYPQVDTPYYGVKGFIESEKKNFDAFEDFKMPIKAMIAEGDKEQFIWYLKVRTQVTGLASPQQEKPLKCLL